MPLFHRKKPKPFVSAVIVAAGSGSRMEGLDKQRAPLDGVPVVIRSIAAFESSPEIAEIIVVCRGEDVAAYYDLVRDYNLAKVASVVAGGKHRQESVFRGIGAASESAELYAIHDGARPLITEDEIARCVEAARLHGAAAVGTPVKDTVKVADADGFIRETPDRSKLWNIATPQIFEARLYREAMARAREEGCLYTDDCQLVERLGRRVYLSPGSYENLKITTPEDLALAEAVLAYREEGSGRWQSFE